MKKIKHWLIDKPIRFYLIGFIIVLIILILLRLKFNIEWGDVIVEAHGLLFDLIVFGILLTIYDTIKHSREETERKERERISLINRYNEEIDDYRNWNEKEAKFRIIGNIKRLIKLGKSELNLDDCYLEKGNLNKIDLSGSSFIRTDLRKCELIECNLQNSNFKAALLVETCFSGDNIGSNLEGSSFNFVRGYSPYIGYSNLKKCDFRGGKLEKAFFFKSDLSESDFSTFYFKDEGNNFEQTNLEDSLLVFCDLRNCNFEGTNLKNAKMEGANIDGIKIKGAILDGIRIDEEQLIQFRKMGVTEDVISTFTILKKEKSVPNKG